MATPFTGRLNAQGAEEVIGIQWVPHFHTITYGTYGKVAFGISVLPLPTDTVTAKTMATDVPPGDNNSGALTVCDNWSVVVCARLLPCSSCPLLIALCALGSLKTVPLANLALHDSHCARHLWRCDECGAVVQKTERDAHQLSHQPVCWVNRGSAPLFADPPAQVRCEKCNQVVPHDALATHQVRRLVFSGAPCPAQPRPSRGGQQSACVLRAVDCPWCDDKIPWIEHNAHITCAVALIRHPPPA